MVASGLWPASPVTTQTAVDQKLLVLYESMLMENQMPMNAFCRAISHFKGKFDNIPDNVIMISFLRKFFQSKHFKVLFLNYQFFSSFRLTCIAFFPERVDINFTSSEITSTNLQTSVMILFLMAHNVPFVNM